MPRWLRQFTFNKIKEHYQKENEANESAQSKTGNKSTLIDSSGNVNKEAWSGVPKPISPASKLKTSYR